MTSNFKDPLSASFFNISVLAGKGFFYIIKGIEKLDWQKIPLNSIQIRSEETFLCYKGKCTDTIPCGWKK